MYTHTIEIFYSKEDEGNIAAVPELLCCSVFGEAEGGQRNSKNLWGKELLKVVMGKIKGV